MRYVFRAVAIVAVLGFVFNLAIAQKALKELPDGADSDLSKDGTREAHQGADNPRQGNRSDRDGRFGGPDPYGPENFEQFIQKAERQLNDPQWQLKIDLQDPKRIVINHADGSSEEYWYVLFRVVNDNTRTIKDTELPTPNSEDVDLNNPPSPLEVKDNSGTDREGVPVDCHLDFELHVFTHDIEKNPWDAGEYPFDPDDEVLSPEALDQRRANMKRVYKPVSNHSVLQKVAEAEGLYEWMGNYGYINEAVMLLHPLSDFQRQIGFSHELDAPDLSGLRCLPYRISTFVGGERAEAIRYVAVYDEDNTFAGVFGEDETLPDGSHLVKDDSDEMYGKLTQRRYMAGDCIDSFGRPLRANDPGYLNARIAGSRDGKGGSYGVLAPDHPAVDRPVMVPHYRLYRDGDKVLFDYDTGIKHADYPNQTYHINGRIVGPADDRFGNAEEVSGSTEKFGGDVVGKPVKVIDHKGRPIRKYIVTYEAGERISQAEWDIWQRRLGPGLLSRYQNLADITNRPLLADDPLIGLPKIKMGNFIGDEDHGAAEVIQRGVDTGRRGPQGEVILDMQEYTTGRRFSPRKIDPADFMRDPDGEFTTNREAPIPPGANLNSGEEYVYAPLGNAVEGAVPVPAFDQYGAWRDYRDELSGARIPLTDSEGKLVRDDQDQILYLKDYEYEYVYLYEYDVTPQDDDGFKGEHGGDRYQLVKENIKFTVSREADGKQVVLPLMRLIWEKRVVREPQIIDGFEVVDADGNVRSVTADEYQQIKGEAPGPDVVKVKIVTSKETPTEVVVGVWDGNKSVGANQRAESWEDAEERATHLPATFDDNGERVPGEANPNVTVENREVIRYVNRFRNQQVVKDNTQRDFSGTGPEAGEFEETPEEDNGIDMSKTYKTYSRWTVPPPMVYRDDNGEWQVLTRLADKIGPANRWDGMDAPRFLTRYVSEMWGVAIFKGVSRDWDYANVYVRGLRGQVSNAGLTLDGKVTSMPSPADGTSEVGKSFFNPRYVAEEWVYRTRYERLGDEFENYRDLIRKVRTFWYREGDRDMSGD
ncbi:MAG: hypothetical protein KDB90_00960 [Planctomycetes bacterium]|nr:hypothetical protein [Planctomycetota bacterium]